jgi:VIT1/CCC1 family predicted Fe2+/Mn2+ transporter
VDAKNKNGDISEEEEEEDTEEPEQEQSLSDLDSKEEVREKKVAPTELEDQVDQEAQIKRLRAAQEKYFNSKFGSLFPFFYFFYVASSIAVCVAALIPFCLSLSIFVFVSGWRRSQASCSPRTKRKALRRYPG